MIDLCLISISRFLVIFYFAGLIYEPGEPVLFQSIHNQFVLRCKDGVLVDGNDRGISKFLYR